MKLKTTIITMLLVAASMCAVAQEKWEYAVVKYVNPGYPAKGIYVSTSGKAFEKIEVKRSEIEDQFSDYTLVLNCIQNMTNSGWRIINTFNNVDAISFVLERKKN